MTVTARSRIVCRAVLQYSAQFMKRVRPLHGGALVLFLLAMYATNDAAGRALNAFAPRVSVAADAIHGVDRDAAKCGTPFSTAPRFHATLRREWKTVTRSVREPLDRSPECAAHQPRIVAHAAEPVLSLVTRTGSLSSRTTSLPPPALTL